MSARGAPGLRVAGEGRLDEPGQDRDEVGRRLAGPGLGLGGHVLAGQEERERLGLDGRRTDESTGGNAGPDRVREGEVGEEDVAEVVAGVRRRRGHPEGL